MEMLIEIIVCLIAGCGAGLGTGFAGMSAAVVITPMLVTFLGLPAYSAIGIALASDVLASGVSAYTYHKNKNIDIKNGIVMMIAVLIFTFIGSFVASFVPNEAMGGTSVFMTTVMGIKFIISPVNTTKEAMNSVSASRRFISSLISGMIIGFICGFVGAGGGMMMLMILTMILRYELKTAVGTSVFVMTFTALTGAVSHFVIDNKIPDISVLVMCIVFTLIFARIGSVIANKVSSRTLNRATGVILVLLGVIVIGTKLIT